MNLSIGAFENFADVRALTVGLGFKLVLAPLVLTLLYVGMLGASGRLMQVTLFALVVAVGTCRTRILHDTRASTCHNAYQGDAALLRDVVLGGQLQIAAAAAGSVVRPQFVRDLIGGEPDFQQLMVAETVKWAKVVKFSGAKAD